MAKNNCEIIKENSETIKENDITQQEIADAESKFINFDSEAIDKLLETSLPGTVLDEKDVNKWLVDHWGSQKKNKILASKIMGLIRGNNLIGEMMYDYILTHLPPGIKVGDEKGNFDLSKFPRSSLKLFYRQVLGMTKAINPEGKSYANFGGIWSALRTPVDLKWREPTGAFGYITNATRDYASMTSRRIKTFMDNLPRLKQEAKKLVYKKGDEAVKKNPKLLGKRIFKDSDLPRLSMKDILGNTGIIGDEMTLQSKDMEAFFAMNMMGWIYEENGKFYIYQDWQVRTDEEGNNLRYDSGDPLVPGDFMFGFENPVLLKDFDAARFPLEVDLSGFSDMTKSQLKRFKDMKDEARKTDNIVFEYMDAKMAQSTAFLVEQLNKSFPSLNAGDVKFISFNPGLAEFDINKVHGSLKEKIARYYEILGRLTKKEKEQYDLFMNAFGMNINDEFIIANGIAEPRKAERRKNHWPVLYQIDVYKPMLDNLIIELTMKRDQIENEIKKPNENSNIPRLKSDLKMYNAKIDHAKGIQANFDNYHLDVKNNLTMPFAKDNKYFKRVSNAYNIRSARKDNGVYYDYLKHGMSAVERNILTGNLISSLNAAKSDAVKRASVNQYRIPFSDPKVEGMFGLTAEGTLGWFGSFTTPERLQRNLRSVNSYLSGMFLSGPMTPITNLTAVIENFHDYGYRSTKDAFFLFNGKESNIIDDETGLKRKEMIGRMIQDSGIAEFSDFFSEAMVNGIVGIQLEQDIAQEIMGEMLLYHGRNRKGMPKKKSEKQFLERVNILLRQSTLYMEASEFVVTNDKGVVGPNLTEAQIKERKKDLKQRIRLTSANKLVQFAIEKKYEFKLNLDKFSISKFQKVKKVTGKLALSLGKGYAEISKLTGVIGSMSEGEKFLRTLGFVIGVQRAWDAGILDKSVPWWKYTDPKSINQAIRIGREYNFFSNFGLSTQDVGRFNYNGFGNLQGKFKYWSQQKFGKDARRLKEAYTVLMSEEAIESGDKDYKAMAKLFLLMLKPTTKQERMARPEIANLRHFVWTQGLTTLVWDALVIHPVHLGLKTIAKPVRSFVWGSPFLGKQYKNFTSDYVSLMIVIPIILANLGTGLSYDEEDKERLLSNYLRRGPSGYGQMFGFDWILAVIFALSGDTEKAIDKAAIPFEPTTTRAAKEWVKWRMEEF